MVTAQNRAAPASSGRHQPGGLRSRAPPGGAGRATTNNGCPVRWCQASVPLAARMVAPVDYSARTRYRPPPLYQRMQKRLGPLPLGMGIGPRDVWCWRCEAGALRSFGGQWWCKPRHDGHVYLVAPCRGVGVGPQRPSSRGTGTHRSQTPTHRTARRDTAGGSAADPACPPPGVGGGGPTPPQFDENPNSSSE